MHISLRDGMHGPRIGYIRVSTLDQNPDRQRKNSATFTGGEKSPER